jgi:uncharacterized RDD family membrane protein YckC
MLTMSDTTILAASKKASFWKRLVAYIFDNLLLVIFTALLARIFGLPDVIEYWLYFVLYYAYNIFCDNYHQATLGKMIMKLRVVGIDDQKPSLKNSIYRNFGKIISALPFFYGFLRILAPHIRQTVHDEWGKCVVIES